jgi:methionine sulfoxide reductase catalytic subunit
VDAAADARCGRAVALSVPAIQRGRAMLIRKPSDVPSSEITSETAYLNRRRFLGAAAAGAGAAALPNIAGAQVSHERQDDVTDIEAATTHNNFYEFGTEKDQPARNAHTLKPAPWSIAVEGAVAKPAVYQLEDFVAPHKLEDRVYRLRCVEAWSMVIPWRGFPLRDLIRRVEPTSAAKFIQFVTLYDPGQMPGQQVPVLEWPYVEGLRMDEAMHPLTLLVTGMYGRDLPNQNGAPIRLVVPWKYGFKSIKSIVKLRFVEDMPPTSWNLSAPREYGFYANVNPDVDHPRWSQARERRITEMSDNFWSTLFQLRKQPTLMFNGYADQVASLYTGLDLRKWY